MAKNAFKPKLTSHTYDEETAKEIIKAIRLSFFYLLEDLYNKLLIEAGEK